MATKKTNAKSTVKKTSAKPAAKKATTTKTVTKKPAAKKPVAKKAVAPKTVAKPVENKKKKSMADIYNTNVSILLAMAIEAMILLLGYLIIMSAA